MKSLEHLFYEGKPFLCLALGIYALATPNPSGIAIACALMLLVAGTFILRGRFQNRRGSVLEELWYEAQPFLYLGLAGYAFLVARHSKFAIGCALILLFCASMILNWRFKNRR